MLNVSEAYIKLISPIIFASAIFFREYGICGGVSFFKNWKATWLAGPLLFICHLFFLIYHGPEFFCGTCGSKYITDTFLIPSIGYAILTFPVLISGDTFDSATDKAIEPMASLIGIILVVYGLVSIAGLGIR